MRRTLRILAINVKAGGGGGGNARPHPIAAPVMKEVIERLKSVKKTVVLGDEESTGGGVALNVAPNISVTGRSLFSQVAVTRKHPNVRRSRDVFVVGGVDAIRRIWEEYKIRPNCVFVPDTDEIPSWCFNEELPTYLVRAPPVKINRSLLSAELNDGFAAEFPCPAMPPLTALVDCHAPSATEATAAGAGAGDLQPTLAIQSALVLHKVAMVSNVGALIRAANSMGFDAVVLDRCTDVYNEKVMRASGGAVVDPRGAKIFQISEADVEKGSIDPSALLQTTANVHGLLPLFTMPAQDAEHVFPAALRFHYNNERRVAAGLKPLGSMVVVGSERAGASELASAWAENMPLKAVSLQVDNTMIESLNAAVASSIVMNHFRPRAAAEFKDIFARGVVPEGFGSRAADAEPMDVRQLAAS